MPNLSEFTGGKAPDYIEFAEIGSSLDVGPTVSRNSLWVTVKETHVVQNTSNLAGVSVDSGTSQMTLPAGLYQFSGLVNLRRQSDGSMAKAVLGLYNVSDSVWITQNYSQYGTETGNGSATFEIYGGFKITASKVFELRLRVNTLASDSTTFNIDNGLNTAEFKDNPSQFTNSNQDFRNVMRFWKLN